MGIKVNFPTIAFAVLLTAAGLTDAATYIVGDSTGWVIPTGAGVYTSWASQHTFAVGDILVFNFAAGQHDVARVNKAAFDICNSTSPLSLDTISPANVTLSSTGDHYFICTFGQHCDAGQKLAINVTSTSGGPTASPPASPQTSPTPPTPSASPSTPPPAAPPTPTPSTAPPTPSPASPPAPQSPVSPAPAPGPSTPNGSPTSQPPPATAPPPGSGPSGSSPPPPSPPPPSSAPPKAVATLALSMIFVIGVLLC